MIDLSKYGIKEAIDITNEFQQLKQENEELKENLRTSCRYYAPGGECALTAHNCPGTAKCIEKSKQKLKTILDICKSNRCIDNNGYCPQIRNIQEIIEG